VSASANDLLYFAALMKSNAFRIVGGLILVREQEFDYKKYCADLISGDDSRLVGFSVVRADHHLGELSNGPTRTALSSRNGIAGSMVGLLPDLQLEADQSEM
jgi:hypothetical protein